MLTDAPANGDALLDKHHRECSLQHIKWNLAFVLTTACQALLGAHTDCLTGGVRRHPQAGLCVSNGGGEAPTPVSEKEEAVQELASNAGGAFPGLVTETLTSL